MEEIRGRQTYGDYLRRSPYLVSRYDAATGHPISIRERIGLLDRKLRVVSENANDEVEWLKWTERAFQSVYGYEFQETISCLRVKICSIPMWTMCALSAS